MCFCILHFTVNHNATILHTENTQFSALESGEWAEKCCYCRIKYIKYKIHSTLNLNAFTMVRFGQHWETEINCHFSQCLETSTKLIFILFVCSFFIIRFFRIETKWNEMDPVVLLGFFLFHPFCERLFNFIPFGITHIFVCWCSWCRWFVGVNGLWFFGICIFSLYHKTNTRIEKKNKHRTNEKSNKNAATYVCVFC